MTKILYIEDNDDNVYMLKMRLELLGDFEVISADDGEIPRDRNESESRAIRLAIDLNS